MPIPSHGASGAVLPALPVPQALPVLPPVLPALPVPPAGAAAGGEPASLVAEAMPLPLRRRRRPPRQQAPPPPGRQAIADLAPADRPRERMLRGGPSGLSDAELVALLLRSGRPGRSVLAIADDLLAACGGLGGLAGCDLDVVRRQKLGEAQAATLLAAVEIGRRLASHAVPAQLLDEPAVVARYLFTRYGRSGQEVMGAVFLDVHHRRVGETELFRGTLMRLAVEPQVILREAIRRSASGILLFHVHPSGDPTPSEEDHLFTARLAQCCAIMGFILVDHLVLGGDRWVSLRRHRPW